MQASHERLDHHERRLAEHHGRLEQFGVELDQVKRQVRDLEQDRSTIRALAETTRELGRTAQHALENVEMIAERAVEKVLERRRDRFMRDWRYRAGWITAAIAAIGFLVDHHIL